MICFSQVNIERWLERMVSVIVGRGEDFNEALILVGGDRFGGMIVAFGAADLGAEEMAGDFVESSFRSIFIFTEIVGGL